MAATGPVASNSGLWSGGWPVFICSQKLYHFVAKLDGVNKARKSCEDYTIVTELQKYVFSCHKILNFFGFCDKYL